MLKPGDRVGVVATGFAVRRDALDAGVRALEEMGYRVTLGRGVRKRDGYLAGADAVRAEDLQAMLADPEIRAIWFARGGYGTARLLDRLDRRKIARSRKLLIGYSDLTALFSALAGRASLRCLYGPVVTELADRASYHAPSLRALLAGEGVELKVGRGKVLASGRARGPLAGGNLTVLASLWGTPFEPDLRGRVLALEETGEEVYRVDRLLTQLRLSGALDGVAAVLTGDLSTPARRRFPPDRSLRALLKEVFLPLGVPVVTGLPFGHRKGKWTLPIGGTAEVDTAAGRVRFRP